MLKKLIILSALLCSMGLPVMATPYTDYCETAINYIINTLGLTDEYLYNNQIDVSVSIMPDGSVKDVYIRNGLSRLVKWENKVLDIKFPSHNLMEGIGGGPDVYVSQRLIRKSYLAKMEHEEFLYNLRQSVKAGFGYYDKNKNAQDYHIHYRIYIFHQKRLCLNIQEVYSLKCKHMGEFASP